MNILVTGGAGFIGSHTVLELISQDNEVIVIDNLENSKYESLKRVQKIASKGLTFHEVTLLDREKVDAIFARQPIDAVIHFAGYKAVEESVANPMKYYENNIQSTLILCDVMEKYGVRNLVFSSSSTVYGNAKTMPIKESTVRNAINPYGRTKLFIEYILQDLHIATPSWNIVLLRYFNPVGAHHSGKIGEDPNGIPNNLMPYISQVAVGKREKLSIFGNDYPTHDGTCVRDYIHVVDLARAHLKAIQKLEDHPGFVAYNLGTGAGYSVLDVVKAFEQASGKKIPYQMVKRRPGDAPICYSDATKAKKEMGWGAEYGLEEICKDAWRWQSHNPEGYG